MARCHYNYMDLFDTSIKNVRPSRSDRNDAACHYILAFTTRACRELLTSEVEQAAESGMRNSGCSGAFITDLIIDSDQVRMKVRLPASISPLTALAKIKAESNRVVMDAFPDLKKSLQHLWSPESFVRTVGSETTLIELEAFMLTARGFNQRTIAEILAKGVHNGIPTDIQPPQHRKDD